MEFFVNLGRALRPGLLFKLMGNRKKTAEDKLASQLTDYRLYKLDGVFNPLNWTWTLKRTKQDWENNCNMLIYAVKFFNMTIVNEKVIFYKENTGRLSQSNTKHVGNVFYIRYPNGIAGIDTMNKDFSKVLSVAIGLLDDSKFKVLRDHLKPIS